MDNETQSVADYALIQNEFLSLMAAVFNHANHTASIGSSAQCDSLRLVSGDRHFGSAGHVTPVFALDLEKPCTVAAWDTKTRSGNIRVRVSAPLSQQGALFTVLLSSYNVNGITFGCDSLVLKTIGSTIDSTTLEAKIYKGNAVNDDFTIRYNCSGMIVAYPAESSVALRNQVRYRGNGSGTNRQLTDFSVIVLPEMPEQKVRSCKYISSGLTKVIPSGFKERLLDYGDGTCNDEASFDVNDNTIGIRLK